MSLDKKGRYLLLTSQGFFDRGQISQALLMLEGFDIVVYDKITTNPTIEDIDKNIQQFLKYGFTGVIALGGGSVIDTAKVLSFLLANNVRNSLRDVLNNQNILSQSPIPLILIPTTAGTGSEATPFATVWDSVKKEKHSINTSKQSINKIILDPALLITLPYQVSLFSGLDAISHSLESLWNKNKNEKSSKYALRAISIFLDSFLRTLNHPLDVQARARMQEVSLLGGLAIAETKTAIAHAISYPLTMEFNIPHGLACSFTLPELLRLNMAKLEIDHPNEGNNFKEVLTLLSALKLDEVLMKYVSKFNLLNFTNSLKLNERANNYHDSYSLSKILNDAL